MADGKSKVDYELQTTLDEAVGKLEGLLAGLKGRQLILRHRTEAVELHPASVVCLAVKGKQKGNRESIEIQLAWKKDQRLLSEPGNDRAMGVGPGRAEGLSRSGD